MKEWTIYLLRTTAEFFWWTIKYVFTSLWKGVKWVCKKLFTKKKEEKKFSTLDEATRFRWTPKRNVLTISSSLVR